MISDIVYAALADISGLTLFSGLRENPLVAALRDLLTDTAGENLGDELYSDEDIYLELVEDWSNFTQAFIRHNRGYSFYLTLAALTVEDENPYTISCESTQDPPPVLRALARTDLSRLGRLASFEIHSLGFHIAELLRKNGLEQCAQNIEEESRVLLASEGKRSMGQPVDLLLHIFPEKTNWSSALPRLSAYINDRGAGVLGQYRAFQWRLSSSSLIGDEGYAESYFDPPRDGMLSYFLIPIENPDPVTLEELHGYEDQRQVIIANTRAFLMGKPANNLLLYGDRGTGKSAAIKAVCNEYAPVGLKLIEIDKKELSDLPLIMSTLGSRKRFFILFIDDISFESTDDSFRALKAFLEGRIEKRPPNVVVYATSNRRHLVKEQLADRPGLEAAAADARGELRAFDTLQEQFSLSDRFGITLVFTSPGQDEYLDIAEFIARRRQILGEGDEERESFRANALKWEKWYNGRSPRTAVQYVDWVAGGAPFPWT